MKKERIRQGICWLIISMLLCACSARAETVTPTSSLSAPQSTGQTPGQTADVFTVDAWVSNPTPRADETVIILGTLRRNGLYLGGIMMNATWPDEDQTRGTPNCTVQVLYQRGVCSTDAGKYPPGVFVPIHISFDYRGSTYTGETGFTPQEKP